jgi:hypothetical protein
MILDSTNPAQYFLLSILNEVFMQDCLNGYGVFNVYCYDIALEGRLHKRGKLNTLLVQREMQILSCLVYFCGIINASI